MLSQLSSTLITEQAGGLQFPRAISSKRIQRRRTKASGPSQRPPQAIAPEKMALLLEFSRGRHDAQESVKKNMTCSDYNPTRTPDATRQVSNAAGELQMSAAEGDFHKKKMLIRRQSRTID